MGVLRAEIRRLARKETRQEIASLKKQVTAMRRRVAEAKSRLLTLERVAKRAAAVGAIARGPAMERGDDGGVRIRFSPSWVSSHRRKLRMSRLLYARLVGVSPQTIMGWERGRSRPRRRALETWRAVREMGVREVKARLSGEGAGAGGRVARRVRKRRVRRVVRKAVRRVRRVSRVRARVGRAGRAGTRAKKK
jgi:transcriptional regulator with XRE-family HTH domain